MINECDRMNQLVTGLLESARPREPMLAPADVHDIVHQVGEMLRERAAARGVVISSVLDAVPSVIDCDRDQLLQVLLNVMLNAIQALADGGRLQVSTGLDGADLCLAVDDDGPGIPPTRRDEILEPFVSDRAGGIGLGLSIVREIVIMHHGRLTISDSPLGGARFTICLPRHSRTAN